MDAQAAPCLAEPRATYAGRTVLAIGAHPDDVELTVGGTVARWSRSSCPARAIRLDLYRDTARLNGWQIGVPYAEGLDVERMLIS